MGFVLLFLLITPSLFGEIGYISAFRNSVEIERGEEILKAFRGFKLEERDVVKTGDRAKAQIRFSDKTVVRLGKNSSFEIEEYLFNKRDSSKAKFRVKRGFFNIVTGGIGKIARENFKLQTKNSTIGIRGTHFQGFSLDGREEIKCLKGSILVETESRVFDLDAGESIKLSMGREIERSERGGEIDLEDRYEKLELDQTIVSMIDEITEKDATNYGNAVADAYQTIQEMNDENLQKYAEALLFRTTYDKSVDSVGEFSGIEDLTDQLFDNSVVKVGTFSADPLTFWHNGREYYTDYQTVVSKMGGFQNGGDALPFWSGDGEERKIDSYSGYFLGSEVDAQLNGSQLPITRENKIDIYIDFGNRYLGLDIQLENGIEYRVTTLSYLNQYVLYDAYKNGLLTALDSRNLLQFTSFGVFSFYYGEDIDEVAGDILFIDELDSRTSIYFLAKKESEIDVFKKSIGEDSIFSWGYWAFKDGEGEKLRGGWISPKFDTTPAEKIEEYIEKSVTASYSGDVFGTVEDIYGDRVEKLESGNFRLNFDFSKKVINGNFNFSTSNRDFSVDTAGDMDSSSFTINGDNFIGDGKLFGDEAQYIGGGFNFITEDKDSVIGAFKGDRD
jgi:hypothetical protein